MAAITVPFPNHGTATVRANETARIVNTSANREIIICTEMARGGGVPTFTFTRHGVELKRASQIDGHPKDQYQRVLTSAAGTLPDGESIFALNLSFTATQYTYLLEHCDEFGAQIKVLKDIDYENADGEDSMSEPIQIFCE